MPQLKFTVTNIDRVVKPSSAKGDTLFWDTETRGLGLRVSPSGRGTYIAQGRLRGTTIDRRVTIGTVGPWTLHDARRKAADHKRLCEDGIDARGLKREDAALKLTLQQVCDEYTSRPGKLKETTKAEIRRHVAKVFAAWKDKPVVSITEMRCESAFARCWKGG